MSKKPEYTDTELLDALERNIKKESLTLWDGIGEFPGGPGLGLSLLGGDRTLREALALLCLAEPYWD